MRAKTRTVPAGRPKRGRDGGQFHTPRSPRADGRSGQSEHVEGVARSGADLQGQSDARSVCPDSHDSIHTRGDRQARTGTRRATAGGPRGRGRHCKRVDSRERDDAGRDGLVCDARCRSGPRLRAAVPVGLRRREQRGRPGGTDDRCRPVALARSPPSRAPRQETEDRAQGAPHHRAAQVVIPGQPTAQAQRQAQHHSTHVRWTQSRLSDDD